VEEWDDLGVTRVVGPSHLSHLHQKMMRMVVGMSLRKSQEDRLGSYRGE
jgi:hypothetical protein